VGDGVYRTHTDDQGEDDAGDESLHALILPSAKGQPARLDDTKLPTIRHV
jgi:hypothetical protein